MARKKKAIPAAFLCLLLCVLLGTAGCSVAGLKPGSAAEEAVETADPGEKPDSGSADDSADPEGKKDDGSSDDSADQEEEKDSGSSGDQENTKKKKSNKKSKKTWKFSLEDIPAYSGEPYIELNGNQPVFSPEDYTEEVFAYYSALDDLGRCGPAYVNVCQETIPSEPRGVIGDIRPSGWHTVKYPDRIEDQYLYNRCHLVAYQLCGENANERNLITGTRYMNVTGMLPFENRVYAYVTAYKGHVLYRATPRFAGDDLVAAGVELEAASVEDGGKGLSFHVFVYNVQPGVLIDYADGESTEDPDYIVRSIPEDQQEDSSESNQQEDQSGEKQQTEQSGENKDPAGQSQTREPDAVPENVTYVGNANSRKFHLPDCSSVTDMAEHNKVFFTGTREEVLEAGFDPCKRCNP